MIKTQYEVMAVEKSKIAPISLFGITGDRNLVASLDTFGPNTFDGNIVEMHRQYSHPKTGEVISLKEPTTAESIIIAAYPANRAKLKTLNSNWLVNWLQAGRIIKTSEGIFVNMPREANGNLITNEQTLKSFLTNDKKSKGIYLLENGFGYAPYETFKQGVMDAGDFIEGGLARVLEASQTSEHLKEITSKKNYPLGINVFEFDSVNEPLFGVAGLYFDGLGGTRLCVGGHWNDSDKGYAFGILK